MAVQQKMYGADEQPIIAACTPTGSGAIALLRLCGTGAFELADCFAALASGKKITELPSHTIHYGTVLGVDGTIIDQVLYLLMRGPRTYTGQDTVEITGHNNQFLIEAIIARAIECGARLAGPGEFTKRAYLNGKIDLVQAEAIAEVIGAQNERALKLIQSQLSGTLSQAIVALEKELLALLTLAEASFEFLDEEQRDISLDAMVRQKFKALEESIAKLKVDQASASRIREGVRVAFIGPVNAGKSTLFNALLGKERSIVSSLPGTTRDSIEGTLHRDGMFWTLVDTAGLRRTDDLIEQEGIARSMQAAGSSDLVLMLSDVCTVGTPQELENYKQLMVQYAERLLLIGTKIDLLDVGAPVGKFYQELVQTARSQGASVYEVSAKTGQGIGELQVALAQQITRVLAGYNSPFILNARQQGLLLEVTQLIERAVGCMQGAIDYELLSYHLNDARAALGQLSGRQVSEEMMDAVFRQFCVGK